MTNTHSVFTSVKSAFTIVKYVLISIIVVVIVVSFVAEEDPPATNRSFLDTTQKAKVMKCANNNPDQVRRCYGLVKFNKI